jgi:hypothetical protein
MIVDEPCLKACEYLYDCNIRTIGSSANGTNFTDYGEITIEYSTLSDENKEIFKFLENKGFISEYGLDKTHDQFSIVIPMDETTTVEEFSKKMEALAKHFKQQDILYGNYTETQMVDFLQKSWDRWGNFIMKEVEKGNIEKDENGSLDCKQTITVYNKYLGYYYDEKEEKYWLDKSLYDKHIIFIKSNHENTSDSKGEK